MKIPQYIQTAPSDETLLDTVTDLFRNARGSVAEAMPMLHKIAKEHLWEPRYNSFGQFIDEVGISRSFASRLVTTWEAYAIQGGVSQLHDVDPDKLYLALQLPGSAADRLEKARVLTRQEIKAEAKVQENGEEHECEPITICKHCSRRM